MSSWMARARRAQLAFVVLLAWGALGCEDVGKKSAHLARGHALWLGRAAREDVSQVRKGLPVGGPLLEELFRAAAPEVPDPESARRALVQTRDKVPELNIAKSTFFAVATADGQIIRSDAQTDDLAGKNLLAAFPALAGLGGVSYLETRGAMPEAARVRGRPDAQWVAAVPIRLGDRWVGSYVTGWSWSGYAYRLETALRSSILGETEEGAKVPLVYVYVLVGDAAYGAPVAPVVNGKAIQAQKPFEHARGDEAWAIPLEIEGRAFGVAVVRVAELGEQVAIAVLRSET